MQVSSNPWDTQSTSRKLRSFDSCVTWDICVLNSWTTQKQDIILLIDRRLARLLSVSAVLETGFDDTFVSLYMWLSFLRMHRELTILLKYSSYVFTIFWSAFWVSPWSVKWLFLAYFYQSETNLTVLEKLFCSPQLHLRRILKNAYLKKLKMLN